MTVTACVPAYRAGRFLARTLDSALRQTHRDVRVVVGVDPDDSDGTGDADDTLRALAPFRADPRVRVHRNPERLGWDGNVRALLRQVDTPWYAVLPHDDLWHPRFVELLLADLQDEPEASVAYADQRTFGAGESTRKGVALPAGGSRRAQWLAFMLHGAEALPWRGLTRTDRRDRIGDFPVDGHQGFAVECEYALALLLAGPARHRPDVLFYKHVHPRGVASASRERVVGVPRARLQAAWQEHSARMAALVERGLRDCGAREDADTVPDDLLRLALSAAMLRRFQQVLSPELDAGALAHLQAGLDVAARLAGPGTDAVRSRLHTVLARHARARGDAAGAIESARAAVAADSDDAEAWLLLAESLAETGGDAEARDCIARADLLAPHHAQTLALRNRLARRRA
jgi:glycosyltransferase involved in cell wall biosynthesis